MGKQEEVANRVDMSYVFTKLSMLSKPGSIQRGRVAIYKDLKNIVGLFEKDKDFMALVKHEGRK